MRRPVDAVGRRAIGSRAGALPLPQPTYVEPGETPREACEREVFEELRIRAPIGQLLVADWAPSEAYGDKILFVFDGDEIDSELEKQVVLPAEELSDWRFHDEGNLAALLIPRLARRGHADLLREAIDFATEDDRVL